MKPKIYPPDTTRFDSNGLGVIHDAISCKTKLAFGQDELVMTYPTDGAHYHSLALRNIILAKPDQSRNAQPYRIYRVTAPMNGSVTVYARHIVYDLMGIPVQPFSASSAADALASLKTNAVVQCPFDFWTDKSTSGAFSVPVPASIWSRLGGVQGSILDVYGGEFQFDGNTVKLYNKIGEDRGVSIRYGKNLTSLEQDANCASCYTGVMPYWVDPESGEVLKLSENVILASGNFDYTRVLPLDLSEHFPEKPTEQDLRDKATNYMEVNQICVPKVSLKVEFVALEQTVEYRGSALLERIFLGDTVEVVFPKMDISAKSRAVSAVYDCIMERYESVTLGSVRQSFSQTVVDQGKEIAKKPDKTTITQLATRISENLTDAMTGALGGSVRLLDTDGDGMPDEQYIADNPDPAKAVKVWRYNYMGWGVSKTGYNGPFTMGATLEDGILAEFITAAKLVAGTIQSADGESFFVDLDNGIVRIKEVQDLESSTQRQLAELDVRADGIESSVSSEIDDMKTELSEVKQDSKSWSARIEHIEQNGVDQVTTGTGISLDKEGFHVDEDGKPTSTLIDASGMEVNRKADGKSMLEVRDTGVKTENLNVRNFVIFGHTRFEKYADSRDSKQTAMFFYPEGAGS